MDPKLWSQPYNWAIEDNELLQKATKLFEALSQAKRIIIDPFNDTMQIRCTYSKCDERYTIPALTMQAFQTMPALTAIKNLQIEHQHFYSDLAFTTAYSNLLERMFQNGKRLQLCRHCFSHCPFPLPSIGQSWIHTCEDGSDPETWLVDIQKPNTLSWKGSAWVLQINFEQTLWTWLLKSQYSYDQVVHSWIIPDNEAGDVAKHCKDIFGNFRHIPKPKIFQGQGARSPMIGGQKAMLAANILSSIPAEFLPKVQKAIRSALHPDRNLDNIEAATKALQAFEETWRKWEGGK